MAFNTAIFYDLENLLKGYSFSQQMITNLSLEEILNAVKQTKRLGDIALQRAYANWGDTRLAIMRGEINELGIDPIQVFGSFRGQKKNAADIQLAIDAIDLSHVRPALEIFVIVSGDGGFASLAKKLHEYGKTVIGCAYGNAANQTFRAVCDEFVLITDPEEEERREQITRYSTSAAQAGRAMLSPAQMEVNDPRNIPMTSKLKKAASLSRDTVIGKTMEILKWYASDPSCNKELKTNGIFLSVVQEIVRYLIPGFRTSIFGFTKFMEYMQFVCKGTEFCVVRPQQGFQAFLSLRDAILREDDILPDLEIGDLNNADGYRKLLEAGIPQFRLPQPNDMEAIVLWVKKNLPQSLDLGTMIETTTTGLGGLVSSEAVKLGLLALVSADAFERNPADGKISEQKMTLKNDLQTIDSLMDKLYMSAKNKLREHLEDIDDNILRQLLPNLIK
ncbi:hypothetical protein MCHI_001408 [Candidatus Magnetoovum chiemensis]|nr:hypothetical protein MCHI_001408 [Candidatus Magnetoovum chiemensis]